MTLTALSRFPYRDKYLYYNIICVAWWCVCLGCLSQILTPSFVRTHKQDNPGLAPQADNHLCESCRLVSPTLHWWFQLREPASLEHKQHKYGWKRKKYFCSTDENVCQRHIKKNNAKMRYKCVRSVCMKPYVCLTFCLLHSGDMSCPNPCVHCALPLSFVIHSGQL